MRIPSSSIRSQLLRTAFIISLGSCLSTQDLKAATVYWDTNSDTAGSGNAGGNWDTGTNWSTDATGESATQSWADGDDAVFSAGDDGTGNNTVTINGTIAPNSIVLEETGIISLSGGSIDITGGSLFDLSALGTAGGNDSTWDSAIIGTGNLTIAAQGSASDTGDGSNSDLFLTGANTFVGDVVITSGVVRADSNFGDGSNTLVFQGGGIVDTNLSLIVANDIRVPIGQTGVYRTYGGVGNARHTGALLGEGELKHTDGGTLRFQGDGSAFSGSINNVRGTIFLDTADWSLTQIVNEDGGSFRISLPSDTSIDSYSGDRDVFVPVDSRLNITSGLFDVNPGAGFNNFWIQGGGALTSSSGTLTANWNVPYTTAGDQAIRILIEDFDSETPLTLVKNGPGGLARFEVANTYTGGTEINQGRITVTNSLAFGTGDILITEFNDASGEGGQAYLSGAINIANNISIAGDGAAETTGLLGAIRFEGGQVSGLLTVSDDARIMAYNGQTGSVTGGLAGSGDLEINASDIALANGTISLSGDASAYTGDIIVSGGTALSSLSTTGGGLSVADGATFSGKTSFAGNVTLGTSTGARLNVDTSQPGALNAAGDLILNGITSVDLGDAGDGTYLIATYGGNLVGDASNLELVGGAGRPGTTFDFSTPGEISVTIVTADLIWSGDISDDWAVDGDENWIDEDDNPATFFQGDNVTFDDSSSFFDIIMFGDLLPSSITVDASGFNEYVFESDAATSGQIASGSLLKKGDATLFMESSNSYSGGTILSAGTIEIEANSALGTGPVQLGDSETLSQNTSLYFAQTRINFTNPILVSAEGTGTVTLGSRANVGGAANNNQFTDITLNRDVIFDSNANDRTDYDGIKGSGSVTITGEGRSIFEQPNPAWTGNLTIDGGTLQLGTVAAAGDRIPDTASVTILGDGLLRLSTAGESIGSLNGSALAQVNTNVPQGGTGTLTTGANGSSDTFDGVMSNGAGTLALTKVGTGIQLLNGANTYTGDTNVNEGTLGGSGSITSNLILANGASLAPGDGVGTFDIGGNATLSGNLSVEIDGGNNDTLNVAGDLDITNASLEVSSLSAPTANVYIIATYGTLNGGAFASLNGIPNGYSIDLAYNDGNTSNNIALVGGGSTNAYSAWEDANGITGAGPEADSNGNGIPNGIEFVLGGDPATPGAYPTLPTITNNGNSITFEFRRTDESIPFGPVVEYGTNLVNWTPAADSTDGITVTVTDDFFGTGVDRVQVTLPEALANGADELFAHLLINIPVE